ncbi:hypothetical protein HC928_07810 [bacterium]|nr:hypothetical protein [bacterium]
MSAFPGKPKGFSQFSTMTPEQWSTLQRLLGGGGIESSPLYQQGSSYLSNLLQGGEGAFKQFEAPAMRQFQEQIIPQIAEGFSGLGAGAQSSSAFQQALGSAAADLSERLAKMRGEMQLGALPQALSYAQQPQSNLQNLLGIGAMGYQQKSLPFWQQLLLGLGGGVGQGLGMLPGMFRK